MNSVEEKTSDIFKFQILEKYKYHGGENIENFLLS